MAQRRLADLLMEIYESNGRRYEPTRIGVKLSGWIFCVNRKTDRTVGGSTHERFGIAKPVVNTNNLGLTDRTRTWSL